MHSTDAIFCICGEMHVVSRCITTGVLEDVESIRKDDDND